MKRLVAVGGLLTAAALTSAFLLVSQATPPPAPVPVGVSSQCSVDTPTGALAGPKIAALAYSAGFRGDDINIAVAVARAESGWNEKATNANSNGSVDYGLFQINSIHEAILASGNWASAADNAKMAFTVWKDAGGSWSPWVTYWRGTYKQYLEDVPLKQTCEPQAAVTFTCDKKVAAGYGNGQIPASALCPLWANRNHRLRADAANGFNALAKQYNTRFGRDAMCITDSYRSYAAQVDVRRRKPGLAAVPGTSNHGWGMALDLCSPSGGSWVVGSDYDVWMHEYAPKYGWFHPGWAEPSGSKPEPWHWEFTEKESQQ